MTTLITIIVLLLVVSTIILTRLNHGRANMLPRIARARRERKYRPLFPKLGNKVWDESRAGKITNMKNRIEDNYDNSDDYYKKY
jgi:hypothetical protein